MLRLDIFVPAILDYSHSSCSRTIIQCNDCNANSGCPVLLSCLTNLIPPPFNCKSIITATMPRYICNKGILHGKDYKSLPILMRNKPQCLEQVKFIVRIQWGKKSLPAKVAAPRFRSFLRTKKFQPMGVCRNRKKKKKYLNI
jgi:hypothetical protein